MTYFLEVIFILAQAVYWLLLRDDLRDQVIWDACLHPGSKP